MGGPTIRPWQQAWYEALYGPTGFYRRPEGPAGHFRTASHAAPTELATALRRLADQHGCTSIVDVGAGRGELLSALAGLPDRAEGGRGRRTELRLHGVDVVPRPPGLPAGVGWSSGLAGPDGLNGLRRPNGPDELDGLDGLDGLGRLDQALIGALVIGWELLDVVPCPILELDEDGVPRVLQVEPTTGREHPGEPASAADQAWCERWWPIVDAEPDDRIEVGAPRDDLWAGLVRHARSAGARALLAVDYAHRRDHRPALGSLTGFRSGRAVPPRPDGSMDLTAHVAIDSVAAAGLAAGATSSELTTQHAALRALGTSHRELLDPGSLGAFSWLLQPLLR